MMWMLMGGILDSDARLVEREDGWAIIGDPTEGALVVASAKAGLRQADLEQEYPRLAEIPFDSGRKMMTTFYEIDGKRYSYTKGAPDILCACCTKIAKGSRLNS